ncbi:L,D-transpeptidase family protein [Methylolobus aquaticus]
MLVRPTARLALPRMRLRILILIGTAAATGSAARAATEPTVAMPELEKKLAELASPAAETPSEPDCGSEVARAYSARKFTSAWLASTHPSSRAAALRSVLEASGDEGLSPSRYRTADMARWWARTDTTSRARLEIALTEGLCRYIRDITLGRSELRSVEQATTGANAAGVSALRVLLQKALDTSSLEALLRQLPPQDAEYQQLRTALRNLRQRLREGGWKDVVAGPLLKPGASDPRIPAIRQRLAASGDFSGPLSSSTSYDAELTKAVRRFQGRHALPQEGIIGAATVSALNIPVEQRARQIIVNLERRRWNPSRSAGRQIVVNIPGFELVALSDTKTVLEMPVVVGKAYQQTPVFDEKMEYLEFNPDWLVPPALAATEFLPELQQDPTRLARKHIRIFKGLGKDAPEVDPKSVDWKTITPTTMVRYAFRQDPGPWNALGRLKFMFPNPHNVYLHDTSEPQFFNERQRTFSHGCIRLSRPEELAAWVLEGLDPPWDRSRIRATVAGGHPLTVPLAKPIPIRLAYHTVFFKDDPLLHFLPDVYGRDAALERLLLGEDTGSERAQKPKAATTTAAPANRQGSGTVATPAPARTLPPKTPAAVPGGPGSKSPASVGTRMMMR